MQFLKCFQGDLGCAAKTLYIIEFFWLWCYMLNPFIANAPWRLLHWKKSHLYLEVVYDHLEFGKELNSNPASLWNENFQKDFVMPHSYCLLFCVQGVGGILVQSAILKVHEEIWWWMVMNDDAEPPAASYIQTDHVFISLSPSPPLCCFN